MRTLFTVTLLALVLRAPAKGADWPQWRCDARRSAVSSAKLPAQFHLCWVRKYPPLRPAHWQVRQVRQQFDLGYEPVVAGGTVFVASSLNDSVAALDLETGEQKWRFYADGPVRFAPVVHDGRVIFGSDDGGVYCLAATDGKLLWRRQGSPSARKVLGSGRLISVWPVRGGPVVHGGRVYFAAGVWPFEGIFVWALDAATGETVWLNDRTGSLYLRHPHGAMALGGPSPQGYLLINNDELVVPSGRAFPAFFDLKTGKLKDFAFGHGGTGSRPGSWFLAIDPSGVMHVDPEINHEIHDVGRQAIGQQSTARRAGHKSADRVTIGTRHYKVTPGTRRTVSLGGKTFDFSSGFPGVIGTIHQMLAVDGKLLVVTRAGGIYCFTGKPAETKVHETRRATLPRPNDGWAARATDILAHAGTSKGTALVLGLGTGRLAEELVRQSQLHVVAIDTDARKVDAFRRRLDAAGLYGLWAAAFVAPPGLRPAVPPYFASIIASEDPAAARKLWPEDFAGKLFRCLRPYGGKAYLPVSDSEFARIQSTTPGLAAAQVSRRGNHVVIAREGPLPGAADYRGQPNADELVRTPLGLLWSGDTYHHHKLYSPDPKTGFRAPIGSQLPTVVQGVLQYAITRVPYGTHPRSVNRKKTPVTVYTDVYTGRAMSADELPKPAPVYENPLRHGALGLTTRVNPLTGIREARNVLKNYGCDAQPVDYGHVYTMRSGTAAYYDKRLESGTVNISGIRSGCRNNIIPADGVLAVPHWLGNCSCNYPNFTSLVLVAMPEAHEQWAAWGPVAVEAPVRRMGINLGAPGDRMVRDGTLWIDFPSVGGPSPDFAIAVQPSAAQPYYRHSGWVRGGTGWPWVVASGIEGLRLLAVAPVARRAKPTRNTYSVRWAGKLRADFTEPHTFHATSDHGFRVWVDGKLVLDNQKDRRRGNPTTVSHAVALTAGSKAALLMEYYRPAPAAALAPGKVELAWSSPSVPKCVIPAKNLFALDDAPGGITGAYYHTEDLKGPGVLRKDPQIRFDWGKQFPQPLAPPRKPVVPHGRYTVRLYFAEPKDLKPGQRVFSVALQGRQVLKDLDDVSEAGGPMRGLTKEFRGVAVKSDIALAFTPKTGQPILSGLELLAE
ncbi:PQQ-binding-like beta-propeller repeat protein [bacterium]|nr:PQQ-binding-like beta-propeller repeat protein [bacterium]